MLDVIKIAKRHEGAPEGTVSFEVIPDELYPQAIADLRESVLTYTSETVEEFVKQHFLVAKRISDEAWDAALKSKDDCPPELIEGRAQALEVARLWFTAKLHFTVKNVPMHLHILKDEKWRL